MTAPESTAWKCDVCGYVHQGSEPPAQCPICGATADLFSPLALPAAPSTPAPPSAAQRWSCAVCGHVHGGAAPPERCPVCTAGASFFEPEPDEQQAGEGAAGAGLRVVVAGAGVAGVTAAEHARRAAPGASVTLVGREPVQPYYRLNLTRLLAGLVERDTLWLHPASWYATQRIDLVQADVRSIDRLAGEVLLDDGRRLPYDRLVLATGAHPFVPPVPGVARAGVHVLRTLADAQALVTRSARAQRAVCIGGGLLGLEAAGALAQRGLAVTVVEGAPGLLTRQLAEPAAALLEQHLATLGIAVVCGARVEALVGDESVQAVALADGRELPADVVVLATGVRPNSYLARQCGLKVRQGVVVDDRLQTSDPRIFAAGDVAEHAGRLYGIWPTAFSQGAVAGSNAGGGEAEFGVEAPSHRIKVLDVDLLSVGEFSPGDASYRVLEHQGPGTYRRLVLRDGALVGANLFGDTSLATALMELVRSGDQVAEHPELVGRLPELGPSGL